jgi:beta-glucosidase
LRALVGAGGEIHYAPGYRADGSTDDALLQEAQAAARAATVAVVVAGLPGSYEEEGADRKHIDLPPGHNALVEAVLAVQPRTVVVLVNGSAVALPWAARVPALVEGWLGGQASGGAVADVLLGHTNPSGKLEETFPLRLEDTPAYLNFPDDGSARVLFGEGLFTGYRWYDARRIEPLFPFGHGLSYTSFEYSDLRVDPATARDTDSVTVTLRVRNTGKRAGQEVVQLYVREQRPHLPRPEQELKAFTKVALDPGAEQEVRFQLGLRDFAVYDPRLAAWTADSGVYDLRVGASSRDIRLQGSVTLEATSLRQAPLDRMSPLRAWLRNPAARARLRPVANALFQGVTGEANSIGDDEDWSKILQNGFIADLPISKLVMLGGLTEQDLARLIEVTNAG